MEQLRHPIGVADADLIVTDSNKVTCAQMKSARLAKANRGIRS
jgi:hypothetical protein